MICFRPLAGISCVQGHDGGPQKALVSVPSRGSVVSLKRRIKDEQREFPSPRGDKLCRPWPASRASKNFGFRPLAGISCVLWECAETASRFCFRPLAGISCVRTGKSTLIKRVSFRPLAGISCVCKTAQLGPVGFGPGSDRITISHSTAAGKWQLEIKIPLIFLREPLQTAMQVAAMETRFAQSADSH